MTEPKREQLIPCYHEGEGKEYIVCDRCLRTWNSEYEDMWKQLDQYKEMIRVLEEALKFISTDPYEEASHYPPLAEEALSKAANLTGEG